MFIVKYLIMSDEIRRNKRVPIAASARLSYVSNEVQKSIESTVASISITGIGLYSDCMLSKGTNVSIEINFISTDGLMKTDSIEGSIVNSNEIQELCYLCIVFKEEIIQQKQPFLFEYLQKVLGPD